MSAAIAERWDRLALARPGEVSLAEGALLIAADEYQDLDVDGYLAQIDEMGQALRKRLRSDISTTEALIALNRYIFDELGFSGNNDDYYDPRNSFLNEVIERRLGIPITLAVLYIEIGRRIGLRLEGVSFPTHFLVKCVLRDGAVIIDPYARGASLGLDDLQARLQALASEVELDAALAASLLAAASPNDIFARMLNNLRGIYLQRGEQVKALSICNRIIALMPEAAEEFRDRGELYARLECFRSAVGDFRHYLTLRPHASDADRIRLRLAELEPLAARLN